MRSQRNEYMRTKCIIFTITLKNESENVNETHIDKCPLHKFPFFITHVWDEDVLNIIDRVSSPPFVNTLTLGFGFINNSRGNQIFSIRQTPRKLLFKSVYNFFLIASSITNASWI